MSIERRVLQIVTVVVQAVEQVVLYLLPAKLPNLILEIQLTITILTLVWIRTQIHFILVSKYKDITSCFFLDGMALATVVIHDTQRSENAKKTEVRSEASLVVDPEEVTSLSPMSQEPSVLSMVSNIIPYLAELILSKGGKTFKILTVIG